MRLQSGFIFFASLFLIFGYQNCSRQNLLTGQNQQISGNLKMSSVKNFNANGDDLIDDSQAFIDAAQSGGLVYIPGGPGKKYIISQPIVLPQPVLLISDHAMPAEIVLKGSGSFVIQADNTTLQDLIIRGAGMSDTGCAIQIDNGSREKDKLEFSNTTITNITLSQSPCFLKDTARNIYAADKNDPNGQSIKSLFVSNIVSTEVRGGQISLEGGFAHLYFRNLTLSAIQPLQSHFIYLHRNQGSIFSDINIKGSGGTGDGIRFDNFSAASISHSRIENVGGSGIGTGYIENTLGPNTALYIANVDLVGNGQYGIDAQNMNVIQARNMNWANNGVDGANFNQSKLVNLSHTDEAWWIEGSRTFKAEVQLKNPGFPRVSKPADFNNVNSDQEAVEFVSIEAYGAVGDGAHDDTVAFKNAVKSGYNIFIPKPKYKYLLTETVAIENKISIVGMNGLYQSNIESTAAHAFDIRSSNVRLQGLSIYMSDPHPSKIGIWIDANSKALANIKILNTAIVNAGYAVTNYQGAQNTISNLSISGLTTYGKTGVGLNLTKIKDSTLDRVIEVGTEHPLAGAFLSLYKSSNVHITESTSEQGFIQPTEGNPGHFRWLVENSVHSILLDDSDSIKIDRWMSDGTNSNGIYVNNSRHVHIADSSFKTALYSLVSANSQYVYFVNSLLHSDPLQQKQTEINVFGSNTVGIMNNSDMTSVFGVLSNSNSDFLVWENWPQSF